ncbi:MULTISPECIES: DUF4350 domain-containing protein [unclassified Streptomyces]|uniref:DUF4350 domain-containing protein n=1 Tax=unclassified Streptomyces TaxID=2593676 RepID=UPI000C28015E|nr:DUF4350 domain-containing protein [Streptomyces sp. CB02959]PJN37441.1 hypothetical protein CG747_27370 [Streptomyces sp. CB02959]
MTTATTTAVPGRSARRLWARSRGVLLGLLLLVIGGLTLAALQSGEHNGRLDPRSADRTGSRALAQLLTAHGITTQVVTTAEEAAAAAGPHSTLLVTAPDVLTSDQLTGLHAATTHTPGRTILLSPGFASLQVFAPGVRSEPQIGNAPREPACSLPAARRAGDVLLGGIRYTTSATAADRCYDAGGYPSLLRLPAAHKARDTVLLGSADFLYNYRLAERGNASLALQLLGAHKHLVWYLPSVSDPSSAAPDAQPGFFGLIPSGWRWALLQLALAAGCAALWRARRLGPLVPERLPVTVPAAETTEGHARLYEQAHARDRASAVLRSATRTRLAPLIGVPPTHAHTPDLLLPAIRTHLAAAPLATTDLHALLFGPTPADDKALVHLADQLDTLENSIVSHERHAPREHPDR